MKSLTQEKATKLQERNKARRRWLRAALMLCAAVAFGTSYALINPATTRTAETYCGLEEHTEHTDECYARVLVCSMDENGIHTHDESCFEDVKTLKCTLPECGPHSHSEDCWLETWTLSCGKEESEGHRHTDECYEEEVYFRCGKEESEDHKHTKSCKGVRKVLICELEETEGHWHNRDCYDVESSLVCGLEETEGHHHDRSCYVTETVCVCGQEEDKPHRHTDACYASDPAQLICTQPVHEHTLQCFSDPEADVETPEMWEKTMESAVLGGNWNKDVISVAGTQLDYRESENNYLADADGITTHGYTRYGEWSGSPYEDWSASFCSFCYAYAGVDESLMPRSLYSAEWCTAMKAAGLFHGLDSEYVPEPGDLLFVDDDPLPEDGDEDETENESETGDENEIKNELGTEADTDTENENENGKKKNGRTADRVALVYDVREDAIVVIEGDLNDQVGKTKYLLSDSRLLGYGELPRNPDWVPEEEPAEEKIDEDPLEELVEEPDEETEPSEEPSGEPAEETEPSEEPSGEPAEETEPAEEPSGEPAEETEPSEEPSGEPAEETESAEEPSGEPAEETEPAEEPSGEPAEETESAEEPSGEPAEETEPAEEPSEEPAETEEPAENGEEDSNQEEPADAEEEEAVKYKEITIESPAAEDGAVAVITGLLPEGAEATIEVVTLTGDDLAAIFGEEKAALMKSYVAYDIKIMVDGEEWQPDADNGVKVVVKQPEISVGENDKLTVTHIDGETGDASEVEATVTENDEITFDAEGFSIYVFTVEFNYGDLIFSIEGYDSILLSELFTELGITESAADVIAAEFTDPALIRVEKLSGDWRLTSLHWFTTTETLTLTFGNGGVLPITVTDALDDSGNYVNPAATYLHTTGANSWQIVAEGYTGCAITNKFPALSYKPENNSYVYDVNQDKKTDAFVQKKVIPTNNENEFLVYLSMAKPISFEEWLRKTTVYTLENNNPFGPAFNGPPSNNGKGPLYPEGEEHHKNSVDVEIQVWDYVSFTSDKNTDRVTIDYANSGTRLAMWSESRQTDVSKCSNGSIYLYMKEINKSIKIARETNFHPDNGTGEPFRIIVDLSLITGNVDFAFEETVLDSVEDQLGPYLELYPTNPADLNTAIVYCDGSVSIDTSGTDPVLEWDVTEDPFPDRIYQTSPKLTGQFNNAAQLVYRVRLKTDKDGFVSCANAMNSAVGDPQSYAVNDHATLSYHTEPMTGGTGSNTSGTMDFQEPYVRGLHYDLWFNKVSEEDEPLSGAKFILLDENHNPVSDELGNQYEFISDTDGFVGLFNLPSGAYSGIYYLRETEAPLFYSLPSNPEWAIPRNYTAAPTRFVSDTLKNLPQNMRIVDFEGNNSPTIENTRAPGQKIVFLKVDEDTGDPISGITFALYQEDESGQMSTEAMTGLTAMVSKVDGVFSPFNMQLPYGTYYLKETATRNGYQLMTDTIKLVVSTSTVTVSGSSHVLTPTLNSSSGVWTVTVSNEKKIPPTPPVVLDPTQPTDDPGTTLKKQIERLADGDKDSEKNLYRLHLNFDVPTEPTDLLLVIDQSTSMTWNIAGVAPKLIDPYSGLSEDNPAYEGPSRQESLVSFLNGSAEKEGFISSFLSANDGNKLAILTFASDSGTGNTRYIRKWADTSTSVTLPTPTGSSNYTAALDAADDVLSALPSTDTNRKMVIFIGDGEPTLAYSDGALQSGFNENLIGSGYNDRYPSVVDAVDNYIEILKMEATGLSVKTRSDWYVMDENSPGVPVDDEGNIAQPARFYSKAGGNENYPELFDFLTADFNIPGVQFPFGPLENNGSVLMNWYNSTWSVMTSTQKAAWVEANTIYDGDTYDIFNLSKQAYHAFNAKYPSVFVYTIGLSPDTAYVFNDTRSAGEVMRYMAGSDRYTQCSTAAAMEKAAVGLTALNSVVLTDPLSDYVDVAAKPALKITMKYGGADYVLYDESVESYASDGYFSPAGLLYLDTGNTGLDTTGKVLTVTMDADATFFKDFTLAAEFTVQSNAAALAEFLSTGYNAIGDRDTDYSETKKTSSEQLGFYSNDNANAQVEWNRRGDHVKKFPKPVAQVKREPVEPKDVLPLTPTDYDDEVTVGKQIDYLGDETTGVNDPDLYRLYLSLKAEDQPVDLMLVLDQSGSMMTAVDGTTTRQDLLREFLNGPNDDGMGFVGDFYSFNPKNSLCVVTFGTDCSTDRNILTWTTASAKTSDVITLPTTLPTGTASNAQATNYAAALSVADSLWDTKSSSTNQKIMIFLSDGEPTLAYADGKMHTGLADTLNPVGKGGTYDLDAASFVTKFKYYLNSAYAEALSGSPMRENNFLKLASVTDDNGVKYYINTCWSFVDDSPVKYPRVMMLDEMDIDIPGMKKFPLGDFTETDASTFKAFFTWFNALSSDTERENWLFGGEVEGEEVEAHVKFIQPYDLFYLTKSAASQFQKANEDVQVYTVGYNLDNVEYDGDRTADEVLKYMAGDENRYFYCNDVASLKARLYSLLQLRNVMMVDTLSKYVEMASAPNLEIKLTDAKYNAAPYLSVYPYLYKNGQFTTLGTALLDTQKTGISGSTVKVIFQENLPFYEGLEVEAAFTVKLTQDALDEWEANGDSYGTMTGDIGENGEYITDHDLNHITSSGKPGFFSNDYLSDGRTTMATWTRRTNGSAVFPRPVVQVPPKPTIKLKKVDAADQLMALEGAEFDLYRELSAATTATTTVTDADGTEHYLLKINTASLVSSKTDPISVSKLYFGHYYLIETRAPDGYQIPLKPMEFDLNSDLSITTTDENLVISDTDELLIRIKNVSGYELPETGGRGTSFFTLGGLALMSISVMMYGFSMRRRKERREKA